jgi:hypothetical protein
VGEGCGHRYIGLVLDVYRQSPALSVRSPILPMVCILRFVAQGAVCRRVYRFLPDLLTGSVAIDLLLVLVPVV